MVDSSLSKRVLIIEDEEILLDVLRQKLIMSGYEVEEAKNGREGLELIKTFNPDVILLDILMPEMNGWQVMENIKSSPEIPNIPIIIISNSGQPMDVKKFVEKGACDYIVKAQFTPEEVVEKVNSCVEKGVVQKVKKIARGVTDSIKPKSAKKKKEDKEDDRIKVLIIEDDPFLSELCMTKLSKEGFKVILATDGQDGLDKTIKEVPSMILLDIRLPGMNGFEVLEKIKRNQRMEVAKIPVVLLSNFGQEDYIERGLSLGAVDFLIKANFTTDEIVEKMKSILRNL